MNCSYCHKEAKWCDNAEVYGKRYGTSYMCYYCKDCDAYVGCHNNTTRLLGTMANKELRQARMKAHYIVDPLWKSKQYTRGMVYARLSDAFGFQIHIGEADLKLCEETVKTVPMIFDAKIKE